MNQIESSAMPEHRGADRVPTELKAIVQVKVSDEESWKVIVIVKTVSRNGAGFSLPRPCSVGRLITLVMPLEPELRAYDQDERLYPVMGLVQYCNGATVDGETVYHIGVGFIGKQIPDSFKADPKQNYRISGMTKDGLWQITESESQFKKRRKPRYWLAFAVTVSLIQKAEKSVVKEETFTTNIGAGGVSVTCSLDAKLGDKVKFACKELDFYTMAVVRNRKTARRETPTLHLEFIDNEFPIEKVLQAQSAATIAG